MILFFAPPWEKGADSSFSSPHSGEERPKIRFLARKV